MIKASVRKCLNIFLIFLLIIGASFLGYRIFKSKQKEIISTKEIGEKRTSTTKVFKNPDNTRTSVIYASPLHYQSADGKWRTISTKIKDLEVREAPFKIKFGINPRFQFTMVNTTVEFIPQLAASVKGEVKENQITYPGVFNATDLKYTILPTKVKEEIILNDSSAPNVFIFEVKSNKAVPSLKNKTLDFGYFRTLPPFASDAEGRTSPVKVALKKVKEAHYLILNLDHKWRESAKYPVIIDPTLIIQPDPTAGKDTHISQEQPEVNYGTYTILDVSGGSNNTRSLIQFDVSSISKGSAIAQATMFLYVVNASGGNVFVRRINSDWDENLVSWNSQPRFEEVVASQVIDTADVWKSWDVTEVVKDWYSGRILNTGIVLLTDEDPLVNSGGQFYSSDYMADVTLRPKLEITYTIETIAPSSNIKIPYDGDFITGTSYTITGSAKDNLGGAGISKVEVSTDGGSSWYVANGTTSWSYEWVFPADGQHEILSRATDLAGNIETPGPGIFVTADNTLPTAQIVSPASGEKISGIITLSGTVADLNLSNFRIEYGKGVSPVYWTQWGTTRTAPISNAVLASGKSFQLDNGTYTFRLIVTDKAGNTSTAAVTINIEN